MAKKTRLIIRKPKEKIKRIIKRKILRGVEIEKWPINPNKPRKTLTRKKAISKKMKS